MHKSYMQLLYPYIPWRYNLELNFVAHWIENLMRFPECLTLWVSDQYVKDYDTIS